MQDLDNFLQNQNLQDVLGAQVPVPGSAAPREKPKSKWGWRWFLRGPLSDKTDSDAGKRPPAPESRADVTWLGELQCVGREIEHNQTWADYDSELTSILGIEGGAEEIFVRSFIPFSTRVTRVCSTCLLVSYSTSGSVAQKTTVDRGRRYELFYVILFMN